MNGAAMPLQRHPSRCRFSLREAKESLSLYMSLRNLEHSTQNTECASICGFFGDLARIEPSRIQKVPKIVVGALNG
jgi:hypothetical protein